MKDAPLGRVPPQLELCPACDHHVFAGNERCPHCDVDIASTIAARNAAVEEALAALARLEAALGL